MVTMQQLSFCSQYIPAATSSWKSHWGSWADIQTEGEKSITLIRDWDILSAFINFKLDRAQYANLFKKKNDNKNNLPNEFN